MRINQLYNQIILNEHYIYNINVFRPFIDCFNKVDKKSKFKLFNAYCFQFNRIHDMYKEKDYLNKSYFDKFGNLNFRKKAVRRMFYPHNLSYFIGYTHSLNSIFLHLTYSPEDNMYIYTGYMQCNEHNENDYTYLISDPKKFGKLKNIPIDISETSKYYKYGSNLEENPIITLSNKTFNFLQDFNLFL